MLERPAIADSELAAALRDGWGIDAATVDFLPLGYDVGAAVFRVVARDGRWHFVKLKRGAVAGCALSVPRALADAGIDTVVAPVPGVDGALCHPLGDAGPLVVYPWIDGDSGLAVGLTERQWRELGALLRRVHDAPLPTAVRAQVPVERFVPAWAATLLSLDDQLAAGDFAHDEGRELARIWLPRRAEIRALVARVAALGERLAARKPAASLCHGDVHAGNVLVDPDGGLHLVDWDQPILAPREQDLMFAPAGADGAAFRAGYGPVEVDPDALAYYVWDRTVADLGDFGEWVLRRPELGATSRRAGVDGIAEMLASACLIERSGT